MAGQVQLKMKFPTGHGGKRSGAGRPAKGPRSSERHVVRPRLRASEPVHVVLRAAADVGSLRAHAMYLAIRAATVSAAKHEDVRIVHMSIQRTHVHLICEAQNRMALAKGIKAFAGSAAKHINRVVSARRGTRRKGSVFPDRYHARILGTPRAVRNCIAYVLNNWRHHREDELAFAASWEVDRYSSAAAFDGWKSGIALRSNDAADGSNVWGGGGVGGGPGGGVGDRADVGAMGGGGPGGDDPPLVVWPPRTWLLGEGWRRHGLIGARDVPGAAQVE